MAVARGIGDQALARQGLARIRVFAGDDGEDPAAQADYALDKIEAALHALGSSLNDVVRTRVYVSDIANWEAVARVHGRRFATIRPANTLIEARLVGPEYLVEIEAEALMEED